MKFLVLFVAISFTSAAEPLKVTLVNPSIPGTPFWDRVTAVAYAAAEDLNIELSVVYGRDNRIFNHKTIEKIAAQPQKPDFVVFMPYGGNAKHSFAALNQAKIPFVTMERTLHKSEQKLVGLPQEKFQFWFGEIYHDNVQAGRLLATTLVEKAMKLQGNNTFTAIGISGSHSGESDERVEGLKSGLSAFDNVSLLQVVPGGWSRERGRDIIHQLSSRYGEINIAWTASDGMALGVLDSVTSVHSPVKHRIMVGGIDWTIEAIKRIQTGEMAASVGGHFMQAAWALVKIYDHANKHQVFGKEEFNTSYPLAVITGENVSDYLILAEQVDWQKVNFKAFTLSHSKSRKRYRFEFSRVLNQLHH